MLTIIIIILIWVVCGLITYSSLFAYFQREFSIIAAEKYKSDRFRSMISGLGGPLGLAGALIGLAVSGSFLFKHGFKFS